MGKVKGRTTVYNNITSPELLAQVNPENLALEEDYLDQMLGADKTPSTLKQYQANLHIFWCWNLQHNRNKFFVEVMKRDFSRFQSHAIKHWGWSPKRIRTVKATLSSLSNFIENFYDDEYPDFRNVVNKIESPANVAVRTKSVFTEEELQGLLDKLVEQEQYMKACLLSLAMNSGRRKTELTLFKVSFFNDENLICDGALYRTPEEVRTKGRGAIGKRMYLHTLAKPFKPYLDMWLAERERLGITSEWLFPARKNGEWIDEPIGASTFDSWAKTFSRMLEKPFYLHSLRHWLTTMLSKSNIPYDIIQEMIGWESTDMVKIYDDSDSKDKLSMYFGAEGIKNVKQKSITDI